MKIKEERQNDRNKGRKKQETQNNQSKKTT